MLLAAVFWSRWSSELMSLASKLNDEVSPDLLKKAAKVAVASGATGSPIWMLIVNEVPSASVTVASKSIVTDWFVVFGTTKPRCW